MTDASTTVAEKRPGWIKRLYLWVLHWADTPYGTPALFGVSFAESSFFPIPPDVLQVALSISKPRRSFFYAFISGLGSVAGAVLGWVIGACLWFAVADFVYAYIPGCTPENLEIVQARYQENAALAIFGAAFTVIPFKVFTIAAGVFEVPLWELLLYSALGRFARFFAVATCIYFFGAKMKELLEKYFGLITFLFFVLLVGGVVLIRYLL